MLFEQTAVVLEVGGQGGEFGVGVEGGVEAAGVDLQFLHQLQGAVEAAVDDVDVGDVRTAEEEGQPEVPVGLFAAAEDGDGVHVLSLLEDDGGGEGGAEGGQFFGVDEADGEAGAVQHG